MPDGRNRVGSADNGGAGASSPFLSRPIAGQQADPTGNMPSSSYLRRLGWRVPLALAATYAFFGSGPAAAKAALVSLPPLLLVGMRGLIAGAVLLAWSVASGAAPPSRRQWASSALIGILILVLGAGGGTLGQQTVPSSIAGVLSALLPIIAACLGYVLFRERLPRLAVLGLVIGVLGVGCCCGQVRT